MITARYYGGPLHGRIEAREDNVAAPEHVYCHSYENAPTTTDADVVVNVTKHAYRLQDEHEVGSDVIADYIHEGSVP